MDTKQALLAEAENLVKWENARQENRASHEPQYDYPDWDNLCEAAANFVRSVPAERWSDEEMRLLLYVVAGMDGSYLFLDPLSELPEAGVALARAALESDSRDARIELAAVLGNFKGNSHAEQVLLRLVENDDECTRRYALMALARLNSPHVEPLVRKAWASEDEYQRMGCLHALFTIRSPLLGDYLKLAESDGRAYVARLAGRIRDGDGEYAKPPSA